MKKLVILAAALMTVLSLCGCVRQPDAAIDDGAAVNSPTEEPVIEEPVIEEPAAEEPVSEEPAVEVGLEVGQLAPDFTVTMADGSELKLSDLHGKPVFLNFWATWCPPCVGELPHMQTVHENYDGLTVLAVNVWDEDSDITGFLESNGYTFPVGIDTGEIVKLYKVQGIPITFILDESGVIAFRKSGPMNEAAMTSAVEDVLA